MSNSRTVDLINIHDYPKAEYSAYWEIRVAGEPDIGFEYGVRFYDYATGEVVLETTGPADNRDEADTNAQMWVLNHINLYKREVN